MTGIRDGDQAMEMQKAYKLPMVREALFHIRRLLMDPGTQSHVIYWTRGPGGLGFMICPCMNGFNRSGEPCTKDQDCWEVDEWRRRRDNGEFPWLNKEAS